MSKPSIGFFDLSTTKGVRILALATSYAADQLALLSKDRAGYFRDVSERFLESAYELGGTSSDQESAPNALITDFNFRDPRLLGYLEKNKLLRMVLMDLSKAPFTNGKDHREHFVRKKFNDLALADVRDADLILELIRISDDLLTRAKHDLLEEPVKFSDPYEKSTYEALFQVSTGARGNSGRKRIFDYREEAALDAFCLWWNRKLFTDRNAKKEPAVRTCVRDVLSSKTGIHKLDPSGSELDAPRSELRTGVYKLVAPGTPSSENQIKVPNKNIDIACLVIEEITKEYISEYENAPRLNLA